jgi:hypothetical protein
MIQNRQILSSEGTWRNVNVCSGSVYLLSMNIQFRRHLKPSPPDIPLMPRGVQYVTLQKYFSHVSFGYLLFFQLKDSKTTHKTKTGIAAK